MDTSDPDIVFDSAGVCSHCAEADRLLPSIHLTPEQSEQRLADMAATVVTRRTPEGYDCVIGLSGGVDSSYTAWLAHRLGLRPLAVHFDNGWNSDTAVSNIRGIVERCDFDLVTLVIDWREFRDLQRAFIRAGVVDIEMLTDHAIMASIYKLARQHGLSTILSGTNIATEHGMPRSWVWNKQDLTNIRSIHKKFGELQLKTFPTMGLTASIRWKYLSRNWKFLEPLDIANFKKLEAMETLKQETGWRDYGGKHYESIFTRFYQAHILPRKFGIDKRKVHSSALIRNGEINRDQAVAELEKPLYPDDELRRDKTFVLKKLGFSDDEFNDIMNQPPVPHDHYATDKVVRSAIKKVVRSIRLSGARGR